jgi:hypothetical protein
MFKKMKLTVVVTTFMFAFIGNMGVSYAADDHKLRILNWSPYKVQVKWYCKGKLKDRDTYPQGSKTRKIVRSKCKNDKDVSVRVAYDWVGTSYLGAPSWYNTMIYAKPNAYTNNVSGQLGYEVKLYNLTTYKDKKCLVVTSDPVRIALSIATLNPLGVATAAVGVSAFDCGGLK